MKIAMFLALVTTLLAPLPPGIAFNPKTKECGYFGGWEDEYATYFFFPPWEKHYESPIKSQAGTCYNIWDVESCCKQLGYTFIGDASQKHSIKIWSPYSLLLVLCNPLLLMVLAVMGIALLTYPKSKKPDP